MIEVFTGGSKHATVTIKHDGHYVMRAFPKEEVERVMKSGADAVADYFVFEFAAVIRLLENRAKNIPSIGERAIAKGDEHVWLIVGVDRHDPTDPTVTLRRGMTDADRKIFGDSDQLEQARKWSECEFAP